MCSWNDQTNLGSVVRVCFSTCGGNCQARMLLFKVNLTFSLRQFVVYMKFSFFLKLENKNLSLLQN